MEATGIEPVSENLSSAGGYKLVPGISFSLPVFSPRQDDQSPAPFNSSSVTPETIVTA